MIELILTRHAKSDWNNPSLTDHNRPLNERGEQNAPMMAERLADSGASVRRLLSSTALRARTTAEFFAEALNVEIELDQDLYLASDDGLLAHAMSSGVDSVMLVAHDPGLSDLAVRLSSGGIEQMPTCAVARFTWDVASWDQVGDRPADTWSLDTPRGGSASSAG